MVDEDEDEEDGEASSPTSGQTRASSERREPPSRRERSDLRQSVLLLHRLQRLHRLHHPHDEDEARRSRSRKGRESASGQIAAFFGFAGSSPELARTLVFAADGPGVCFLSRPCSLVDSFHAVLEEMLRVQDPPQTIPLLLVLDNDKGFLLAPSVLDECGPRFVERVPVLLTPLVGAVVLPHGHRCLTLGGTLH